MDSVKIQGGSPLRGNVSVSGAKNAALPMMAAALLGSEPSVLENVPNLSDVRFMADILRHLGAEVTQLDDHSWRIFAKDLSCQAPYDLVRKMRASVCLMGPLLARLNRAEVPLPGGCVIGQRPIDLHLKGFEKLGCKVEIEKGIVLLDGSKRRGADVFLGGRYGSTVTGTTNVLMAAVMTPGKTCIESAACEPEVVDLCYMLRAMGAKIDGIGSHELRIEGVSELKGVRYGIMGDRIEAGTFIVAGLMHPENDIRVDGFSPKGISSFLHLLESAGACIEADDKGVRICGKNRLSPVEITTLPFPGFATDLQAQMCALMTVTPGISIITERIYPNRFMHIPELRRMGADVRMEGETAIINGGKPLSGAPVMASDLRASASLYLAGLVAKGETEVQRIYHLDRGYEAFDSKLKALGASIERIHAPETAVASPSCE